MNNNQQNPIIKKFPSNKTVLLTSLLSVLIPSAISVLAFKDFSIYLRIIICLSIACLVLFIDAVYYFIKEREYYYIVCYLENNINLLQSHIKQIETKISD